MNFNYIDAFICEARGYMIMKRKDVKGAWMNVIKINSLYSYLAYTGSFDKDRKNVGFKMVKFTTDDCAKKLLWK